MPRPPIFELLLRAIVWTPVGLIIMVLWLASVGITLLLPVISFFYFYAGDYWTGTLLLLGALPAYFIARALTRRFWHSPDSLL